MQFAGVQVGPDGHVFFRPRTGPFVCGVWLLISVLWAVLEARNGISALLWALPLILTLIVAVVMVFGRPAVEVSAVGVRIRNVVRDVDVPFAALVEISTQYCLKLSDRSGRTYQAWAAPAPSRFSTTRVTDEDLRTLAMAGASSIPASATLRSDAGAAAATIRVRWRQYQDSGDSRPVEPAGTGCARVSWAWPWLVALLIGTVLTALTYLLR